MIKPATTTNRPIGLETEYGLLLPGHDSGISTKIIRDRIFECKQGLPDQEPYNFISPHGGGGFLRNGGRVTVESGHLEYSAPECGSIFGAVAYDMAGELLFQRVLSSFAGGHRPAIVKNNIDHHTGATWGCHENYLMDRRVHLDLEMQGLLSFLVTRQIFAGAGRVGGLRRGKQQDSVPPKFQISQRADHILHPIHHQASTHRSIVCSRDIPYCDDARYRRLHLILGDSNMSPFATALKLGTTSLMLALAELQGPLRQLPVLDDPVAALRQISREATGRSVLPVFHGGAIDSLELQYRCLNLAQRHLRGLSPEADWTLDGWKSALDALDTAPESLIGAVDWVTKRWMLEEFCDAEGMCSEVAHLCSFDLAYHFINRTRGLFYSIAPPNPLVAGWNQRAFAAAEAAVSTPPRDTRAFARGTFVSRLLDSSPDADGSDHEVHWDSVRLGDRFLLPMSDPCCPYAADLPPQPDSAPSARTRVPRRIGRRAPRGKRRQQSRTGRVISHIGSVTPKQIENAKAL